MLVVVSTAYVNPTFVTTSLKTPNGGRRGNATDVLAASTDDRLNKNQG